VENHIYLNNLLLLFFLLGPTQPICWAGPQPTCIAGLDSDSPAWSLAWASDHLQKEITPANLRSWAGFRPC